MSKAAKELEEKLKAIDQLTSEKEMLTVAIQQAE